jgi:hypothetical protein
MPLAAGEWKAVVVAEWASNSRLSGLELAAPAVRIGGVWEPGSCS